ncbi:MAG TPA: hypothetical protein DCX49_02290 [Flavobacteriales bacterium]|nr:hypothetical protein [Flavobacteriales bacterium]
MKPTEIVSLAPVSRIRTESKQLVALSASPNGKLRKVLRRIPWSPPMSYLEGMNRCLFLILMAFWLTGCFHRCEDTCVNGFPATVTITEGDYSFELSVNYEW